MAQKLIKTLLLLVFTGLVPIGCCKEVTLVYANLRQINLILAEPVPPLGNAVSLSSGARTRVPELLIHTNFDYDYLAVAPVASPFANQTLAWSCDSPGDKGLKDKVAAATLSSSSMFNGVPAGQSLQQFVRCKGGYDDNTFPLAELADSLSAWEGGKYGKLYTPLTLYVSPKPQDNPRQQFELRIQLVSGKELRQITHEIIWE